MNHLVIIGARGFGREVFWLATDCIGSRHPPHEGGLSIKGFLDDKADALDGMDGYPPILGPVESYHPEPGDVFVCALGFPGARRKYADLILRKGGRFMTLIHPRARVSQRASLGPGCLVFEDVGLSCEVEIGAFTVLQNGCLLGHDVRVGEFCQLNARCFLGGHVIVGDEASIHVCGIIHPGKRIGERATVGAGAFVIRDVKPGTTVYGNPAKVL